jgi:hypothetical protein
MKETKEEFNAQILRIAKDRNLRVGICDAEKERYQIIWGFTRLFKFRRYTEPSWCYIYEWILCLGIVQIRKWSRMRL